MELPANPSMTTTGEVNFSSADKESIRKRSEPSRRQGLEGSSGQTMRVIFGRRTSCVSGSIARPVFGVDEAESQLAEHRGTETLGGVKFGAGGGGILNNQRAIGKAQLDAGAFIRSSYLELHSLIKFGGILDEKSQSPIDGEIVGVAKPENYERIAGRAAGDLLVEKSDAGPRRLDFTFYVEGSTVAQDSFSSFRAGGF